MKYKTKLKKLFIAMGAGVLLVAFNNCGEGYPILAEYESGDPVFFSKAPGESCEDALLRVYANTFHPFLNQSCNKCHISGPGIGVFASPDVKNSYTSFNSIGIDKISTQSVNNSHQPPYTGSQNTERINELKKFWSNAQTGYAACMAEDQGSGSGTGTGTGNSEPKINLLVRSTNKQVSSTLSTSFVRMEWDLETLSSAKVPLIAGIDIRRAVSNGVTLGYEFRNPTLRLKSTASGPYETLDLNIYINNTLSEVTTYTNIDVLIDSTVNVILAEGVAHGFAVMTPSTSDVISLEFSSLGSTSGAPNPGSGSTVTYTQLVATNGIFANNCLGCHNATRSDAGLNLSNYTNAKAKAALIKTRVNSASSPMPTSGLLPQAQRDMINAWVDQGAPQ